jgi:hypothetical protein
VTGVAGAVNATVNGFNAIEDGPASLMTMSSAIMIVVLFTKVSALYLCVVISSLIGQLEKPPFYHNYTSFGV